MSVQVKNNPLRDVLTTSEPILYDATTSTMTFTQCTYKNLSFSRIVWDFGTNTLIFYKNGNVKYRFALCLTPKIYECAQNYTTMSTDEEQEFVFYDETTKRLFQNIQNDKKIEHLECIYNTDTRHFITLIGEYHDDSLTDYTHTDFDSLVQHLLNYFDTFVQSETVIDFFLEVPFLYQKVYDGELELFEIYHILHDTYKDSSYIRLHRVDIRRNIGIKMLYDFIDFLQRYNDASRLYDGFFLTEMSVYIPTYILPLLDITKTDTFTSIIHKQYTKMNQENVYNELFHDLFDEKHRYFVQLLSYLETQIHDFYDLTDENKDALLRFYKTLITTQYINDIALSFMDMYTIGRMLKQNYTYCVFYGGTAHTTDISNLILAYFEDTGYVSTNKLKSTDF